MKKKAPADLWKEDLAAFSEELEVLAHFLCESFKWSLSHFDFNLDSLRCFGVQRIEAKEKENAMMPVKGAGKGKAVKVKKETLPTPQGRRVVPRITSAMKAEANKKALVKKGEGKRVKKVKVNSCL